MLTLHYQQVRVYRSGSCFTSLILCFIFQGKSPIARAGGFAYDYEVENGLHDFHQFNFIEQTLVRASYKGSKVIYCENFVIFL